MRVFLVAFLIALAAGSAAGPALAQFTPGFHLGEGPQKTEAEIEREKANEEAARAARSKIPDGKASNDPWASVRSSSEPASGKPAPKTVHKRTSPKAEAQ